MQSFSSTHVAIQPVSTAISTCGHYENENCKDGRPVSNHLLNANRWKK